MLSFSILGLAVIFDYHRPASSNILLTQYKKKSHPSHHPKLCQIKKIFPKQAKQNKEKEKKNENKDSPKKKELLGIYYE